MKTPVTETIYIALRNLGPDALRPVQAVRRANETFLIVSRNDDPEDEDWQFASGTLVNCEQRQLPTGTILVATRQVVQPAPKLVELDPHTRAPCPPRDGWS